MTLYNFHLNVLKGCCWFAGTYYKCQYMTRHQNTYSATEDSEQLAHQYNLLFVVRFIGSKLHIVFFICEERCIWLEWIDSIWVIQMSRDMRFPTMWFVRPAKAQISLRIRAVWSEPLLVACIFYDCRTTDWTSIGASKPKGRLHRLAWVDTSQNATLLEISCRGSNVAHCLRMCDTKGSTCLLWDIATDKSGLCCYAVRITQNTYVKK